MTQLPLLLILSVFTVAHSHADPVENYSFSFPATDTCFQKAEERRCPKHSLGERFAVGSKVVLLSDNGVCGARIAGTCTYCDNYGLHKGSELIMDEEWNLPVDEQCRAGFRVAVIGVEHAAVRLVPMKEDNSRLSEEVRLRARQVLADLLKSQYRDVTPPSIVHSFPEMLNSPPAVIRAQQATLLSFQFQAQIPRRSRWRDEYGIMEGDKPVLVLSNNAVPLLGTFEHLFFSVSGKLYLTCLWSCKTCSQIVPSIYDLSGETPELVKTLREK